MLPIVMYLFSRRVTFTKIHSKYMGLTSGIINSETKWEDTCGYTSTPGTSVDCIKNIVFEINFIVSY